ncbi:MAG: cation-translocating P-type ATPase [Oscillospiraceae bacterium]|nr:cation-translocating P-type ATPase [Oscillospiraceae bacterium]
MSSIFYNKSTVLALEELKTDSERGLAAEEAGRRLELNGPNRFKKAKKKSLFMRIIAQFKDFLVIILLLAAFVSVLTGDGLKDALIILSILIVNMIIGITQENKADNALKELKDMSSPKAKVKRDGHIEKINCEDLVVGDIVVLDAGDYVPADVRIIESVNLKIDESALTGESEPVAKDASVILEIGADLGDRINSASMGTVVTYGRGAGVVCATGMDTEMGKIATVLSETDEGSTPLQDKLNSMAKTLGIICIVACAIIFGISFLYNFLGIGDERGIIEMLMISVSLAVAAVPEGVAIVATVILVIGVQKMVRQNVIVKKLRAVETLGSTTVICSDKTGTMTQNKMCVVKAFDTKTTYEVTGSGYSAKGRVGSDGQEITKNISLMAEIAVLCNDAFYDKEAAKIIGDPTEAAMLVFGAKLNLDKDELNARYKRVGEIPFDSDRKLMSVLNIKGSQTFMSVKGAPDGIIARCERVYVDGEIIPMTDEIKQRLLNQNELFASQALRVLGFAYKEYENKDENDISEDGLIYVGMMCMIDPPREEVRASVSQCRTAGINVKMITGDHKITAGAIAKELGINEDDEEILDGSSLSSLTDVELREKVKTVNVFARVSPEHKVRIVTAIKHNNNIVAMTGDGVNDAPSLKRADIGIAMGITGTDVSKEAADMILSDDNFVSIVGAVEQGRTIYENIRKVTSYLLACNMAEILLILIAIILGLPAPLVATQLLFVNLLTDAFPAFALGMEGKEEGIMLRKPRNPKEPIINKAIKVSVALRSLFICAGALGAFLFGYFSYGNNDDGVALAAVSMCFFTLVTSELLVSYPSKSDTPLCFRKKLFENRFLNITTVISMAILFAVMYVPFLNDMFTTSMLNPVQFAVCTAFVLFTLAGSEFSKRLFKRNTEA